MLVAFYLTGFACLSFFFFCPQDETIIPACVGIQSLLFVHWIPDRVGNDRGEEYCFNPFLICSLTCDALNVYTPLSGVVFQLKIKALPLR